MEPMSEIFTNLYNRVFETGDFDKSAPPLFPFFRLPDVSAKASHLRINEHVIVSVGEVSAPTGESGARTILQNVRVELNTKIIFTAFRNLSESEEWTLNRGNVQDLYDLGILT